MFKFLGEIDRFIVVSTGHSEEETGNQRNYRTVSVKLFDRPTTFQPAGAIDIPLTLKVCRSGAFVMSSNSRCLVKNSRELLLVMNAQILGSMCNEAAFTKSIHGEGWQSRVHWPTMKGQR